MRFLFVAAVVAVVAWVLSPLVTVEFELCREDRQ